MNDTGGTVLISFSSHDEAVAERLAERLRAHDIEPWLFTEGHCLGKSFLEEIYDAIDAADAVVFLVSEPWLRSEWCHDEVNYAATGHKTALPIVIDKSDFTSYRAWKLLRTIGAAVVERPPTEDELDFYARKLVELIGQSEPPDVVGRPQATRDRAEPPEVPRAMKRTAVETRAEVPLLIERRSGTQVIVKVNARSAKSAEVRSWLSREYATRSYTDSSWQFTVKEFDDEVQPRMLDTFGS